MHVNRPNSSPPFWGEARRGGVKSLLELFLSAWLATHQVNRSNPHQR